MKKSAPSEREPESPVPFHVGSNGELVPRPKTRRDEAAERTFRELVAEKARRLGLSRRDFVGSVLGTSTALWVINQFYGCSSDETTAASAAYDIDAGNTEDADAACERLMGDEFIFDVQTHHVNPDGPWRDTNSGLESFLAILPQGSCGETDAVACFSVEHYMREIYVNSDTTVAVLSALPAVPSENPLEAQEAQATKDIINALSGSPRCVTHAIVLPNLGQAQLDGMQQIAEENHISAWKVYTPVGGWRLDDPAVGIPFIEKARSLGIKLICAHKGLVLPGFDAAAAAPEDIGVVAEAFPDVNFCVYHSAYETNVTEAEYDPMGLGVDRLIKACADHGIGPTGNVYAELGSTWRQLMTDMTQAAHVIGKLLMALGEDRILWGTDSIWYGTPQDQIMAFRAFQIPEAMQDQFGYPAITDQIRRKIFGLNAAALYGIDPDAVRCEIT
ncbi:MAG TPA: amidohydrolase family protein, partial [Polyangiaceae bacterium]|nr:amidohydrolase family protein [Polyangiaceae bacterium]